MDLPSVTSVVFLIAVFLRKSEFLGGISEMALLPTNKNGKLLLLYINKTVKVTIISLSLHLFFFLFCREKKNRKLYDTFDSVIGVLFKLKNFIISLLVSPLLRPKNPYSLPGFEPGTSGFVVCTSH
jgi:hypothetical protein